MFLNILPTDNDYLTGEKKISIKPFKSLGSEFSKKKVLVKLPKNTKLGDKIEIPISIPRKNNFVILPKNYLRGNHKEKINNTNYEIKLPMNAKANDIYLFKLPTDKNEKLVTLVKKYDLPTEVMGIIKK